MHYSKGYLSKIEIGVKRMTLRIAARTARARGSSPGKVSSGPAEPGMLRSDIIQTMSSTARSSVLELPVRFPDSCRFHVGDCCCRWWVWVSAPIPRTSTTMYRTDLHVRMCADFVLRMNVTVALPVRSNDQHRVPVLIIRRNQ